MLVLKIINLAGYRDLGFNTFIYFNDSIYFIASIYLLIRNKRKYQLYMSSLFGGADNFHIIRLSVE